MKELQEKLIENLKGYSFKEILNLLNKQEEPEIRGTLMNAMEKYHKERFYKWLEEVD